MRVVYKREISKTHKLMGKLMRSLSEFIILNFHCIAIQWNQQQCKNGKHPITRFIINSITDLLCGHLGAFVNNDRRK